MRNFLSALIGLSVILVISSNQTTIPNGISLLQSKFEKEYTDIMQNKNKNKNGIATLHVTLFIAKKLTMTEVILQRPLEYFL